MSKSVTAYNLRLQPPSTIYTSPIYKISTLHLLQTKKNIIYGLTFTFWELQTVMPLNRVNVTIVIAILFLNVNTCR